MEPGTEAITPGGVPPPPPPPPQGRVARLHFRCNAELPIGSNLHVTGSLLLEEDSGVSTETNSVPLYTTPETYPLWKTRRPVVVVLHKAKGIQHHYYRYFVTTPGAATEEGLGVVGAVSTATMDETDDNASESSAISAPNEFMGNSTDVSSLQWEHPSFGDVANIPHDLANMPYRTIDIQVDTAQVVGQLTDEVEGRRQQQQEEGDNDDNADTTEMDGREIDTWNNKEDVTFQPYLILEAIHQKNRTRMISTSNSGTSIGGHATPPPTFGPHRQRIFFVCFHLPVVVVKKDNEWKASWSESILAKTEGSQVVSQYQTYWVGTVTTHPPITSEDDKEAVRKVLKEMDCIPLFLDKEVRQAHYYGFCKQILWPAFHNVDILDLSVLQQQSWDQSRLQGWWSAFQAANKTFADVMVKLVQPQDIVWVHDYHLSLLPKLLFDKEAPQNGGRPLTRKVFFLHIPFPTSQIFRELECGEDLLEGMLHANVLGFHTFDHARHFLNASKRILGLNYETLVGGLIGVHFHGRTVMVTMANVSIEPPMIDAALQLPSVTATSQEYKNKHKGRTIIGGLDIGQGLQGVALKFLAYERLLKDYPSWVPKVVMVQRVLVPGSRADDERQTVDELRNIAQRISASFGANVMDYKEIPGTSLPTDQRLALWKASDILMATPIREGLNHWPMEYVYAHKEPEKPGVVIASEFSAVASILNGALRVNPYDVKMTVTTIDKALTMDLQEREGRRYRDIDFVSTSPSGKWVKNVLRDLKDAIALQQGDNSQSSTSNSTPSGTQDPHKGVVQSTADFLTRESTLAFNRVNHSAIKAAYDTTNNRVFILDFNGTIIIKEPPGKYLKREILGTSGNKPQPHVVEALTQLCADPRNTVYVVSGDSSENVLNALGHVPGLGMGVSNGAHFSPPALPSQRERSWFMFDLGVDWGAVKRVALPVLSKYTARSNGSFVKLTRFSIGWSYYSCDPEWGSQQASHLVMELESELAAFDVRFVTLKGVVEIVPRRLNKGLFVKKVLRDVGRENPIDFVLCMGDDISDEKMFASVYSYVSEIGDEPHAIVTPPVVTETDSVAVVDEAPVQTTQMRHPFYAYTIAVGKKPSLASHWINDAQEVGEVLLALTAGVSPKKEFQKEYMFNTI